MTFNKPNFSTINDVEFFQVLRERVNDHFESSKRSRHCNTGMVFKTFLMLLLYFGPYSLILSGIFSEVLPNVLLWMAMGVGMTGIGLNIMHDANHRAYSAKKGINNLLGYSMNVIGANAEIWKLQHNQLHHTYTNIEGTDDDIHTPPFLRFSPHRELRPIHKYQFIYVWFFYGISTLSWVITKEFLQLKRYDNMGLIKGKKKYKKLLNQLIGWKLFYYVYMLVLPMIFSPLAIWQTFLAFLCMHFTAGLLTSSIFQTAHVMPNCDYPLTDDKSQIENSWAVHEMLTTSNYSPKSRLFSWFIGGLNYQIEHHLFPSTCHVHYWRISKIVASTAKEFGIPYNMEKSFLSALINHVKMLHQLGRDNKKMSQAIS